MNNAFFIDPDITKATTLPGSFYSDVDLFEKMKDKIFVRSWHWLGDESMIPLDETVYPFTLLEHFLSEPMLLVRDRHSHIRLMSNVCTHRGNLLMHHPGKAKQLTCMYHGRRFDLDGSFRHMPEFKEAENFPRPCDDLHQFDLKKWGPFLFGSLNPDFDFDAVLQVMNDRIGHLPLEQFRFDSASSKDYLVSCHWALYCDNYLEGFHIPFVHADLNAALDYGQYDTVLYNHCNLQIGYASSQSEETFHLPEGHMDYGRSVAAYYFWIFPNMMFNFYPWGLSINIVKPISTHKTRVSFLSYIYDESKIGKGAGALLDKVEREDEFVVESVHRGLQSRFYSNGRFSPTREKGVHHFQRLLASYIH